MPPDPDFRAALAALTSALDEPDVDLLHELSRLGLTAGQVVSSYLGLTVTVTVAPSYVGAVDIVVPPAPWADQARASIRLTPPPAGPAGELLTVPSVAITLYAATPGAFVDLAADLAYVSRVALSEVELDRHLPAPGSRAGAAETTLADVSVVNQALGVLMDQGHASADAPVELGRLAEAAGVTVVAAALLVLAATQL